jgi:hypothetical protein
MTAIIVVALIVIALGYALHSGRHGANIADHPYSNRYSDASGAREEHVG